MADIRTTSLLDSFQRPNEDPLSGGGIWGEVGSTSPFNHQMRNFDHSATGFIQFASFLWWSRYIPLTISGDMQIWGQVTIREGAFDAYEMGFFSGMGGDGTNLDGYLVEWTHNGGADRPILYRMDNSVTTILDTYNAPAFINPDTLLLMQIVGDDIETYYSNDAGANWTLANQATDTTYRSGLSLMLGTLGQNTNLVAWVGFGGGNPATDQNIQLPYLGVGP